MDKGTVGELLTQAVKRKPPANPIIGQKRADEWDRKIDGLIVDLDVTSRKVDAVLAAQEVNRQAIMSTARWIVIRDCIIILLLVTMLGIISFNTSQLWSWE